MPMRILTPQAALALLRVVKDTDPEDYPPEILFLKKEIAEATRNAELFVVATGAVDYGMVDNVVTLRLRLDALYAVWGEREAGTELHETVH